MFVTAASLMSGPICAPSSSPSLTLSNATRETSFATKFS